MCVGGQIDRLGRYILCLRSRASLVYINNCPTRCNTKQSIHYSASSLYMFWVSTTPIIRRTQNCNYSLRYSAATSLQLDQFGHVGGRQLNKKIWPVPEAVVTVLCTPDDGCGWHTKHVEWTCRIITRLLCVVSCWIIINTGKYSRHFRNCWPINVTSHEMRRYKYITSPDKNLIFNCSHQTDRDLEKLRMTAMLFFISHNMNL